VNSQLPTTNFQPLPTPNSQRPKTLNVQRSHNTQLPPPRTSFNSRSAIRRLAALSRLPVPSSDSWVVGGRRRTCLQDPFRKFHHLDRTVSSDSKLWFPYTRAFPMPSSLARCCRQQHESWSLGVGSGWELGVGSWEFARRVSSEPRACPAKHAKRANTLHQSARAVLATHGRPTTWRDTRFPIPAG
jgi:hypothetical protein